MAFDGVAVSAIVSELNRVLISGRITKISQPEADEVILSVKTNEDTYKLLLSASASLPVLYLTTQNKPNPMTAPNFCMVLRKHLQGGRILSITQPGLERVINIEAEHLNEMGDLCKRTLILEVMGKHSNLILIDEDNRIIDALKHVGIMMSSVREVLPGRDYFIPKTSDKTELLYADKETIIGIIQACTKPVSEAIYQNFVGISPKLAHSICFDSGIPSDVLANELTTDLADALYVSISKMKHEILTGKFSPKLLLENRKNSDFTVVSFHSYSPENVKEYDSVSELLSDFYSFKKNADSMKQKAYDLTKHVHTILERDIKKYDLQQKQLNDAKDREKYKLYGELLNAYAYQIPSGGKKAEVLNYYTNETITIPLNEFLSVSENAKKYYDRYNKMKRTATALTHQIEETRNEIETLENISTFLSLASSAEELSQIREELIQKGFVRKTPGKKEKKKKVKPLHYRFMDYDIYVGKNNLQNEEVTFGIATGNDWWFHAKAVPGSHVVVRAEFENQAEEWDMPDEVFEVAAALAAKYSKNGDQDKVEVDYLRKKKVKKPSGANPGFVVYYSNYSMTISPDIERFALTINPA